MPAEFIFDGGQEFKAQVKTGAAAYDANVHQTTPNHSKSLGIVERFNRTTQRTLAHVTGNSGTDWQDAYLEAIMAYDASVHQHLSTAGEPLTPGELWYGQKLNVPSLVIGSVVKEDTNLQVYAFGMPSG